MSELFDVGVVKGFYEGKFVELKSLSSLKDLVLSLVAFGCEFGWVVDFVRQAGYLSFTEAQLVNLVRDNVDEVKVLRDGFRKDAVRFVVSSSSEILPRLRSLYEETQVLLEQAKASGNLKVASNLINNTTRILEVIGKLRGLLREAEDSLKSPVLGAKENFEVFKRFAGSGLIKIVDERGLKERLGLIGGNADFVDRFLGDVNG